MATETGGAPLPEIRVPTALTFAGLIAGLALGIALDGGAKEALLAVTGPVGMLWLQALKMTILPLVAGLLFTGIVQTAAAARAGAMAKRTLGLFLLVLAASAATGIVVMPLLLEFAPIPAQAVAVLGSVSPDTGEIPGIGDFLAALIPENVIAAASGGAMLPVIVFIALFALASTRLAELHRRQLALFFEALAGAMMVVIGWVLALAPLGVFALAFGLAAGSGSAAIATLAHYIVLVSSVGAIVLAGAYALAIIAARQVPGRLVRALLPAQAVAISTQSSLASLPAMLASCRKLEVSEPSSELVLPLAVTIFRATSPAMNLAVAIYAARLVGVELGAAPIVAGAVVALLISLSTVSLPGTASFIASVGPIALAMGIPVEPLALLVSVEMLPDIMRTLGNVTMDVAVTAVIDRDRG